MRSPALSRPLAELRRLYRCARRPRHILRYAVHIKSSKPHADPHLSAQRKEKKSKTEVLQHGCHAYISTTCTPKFPVRWNSSVPRTPPADRETGRWKAVPTSDWRKCKIPMPHATWHFGHAVGRFIATAASCGTDRDNASFGFRPFPSVSFHAPVRPVHVSAPFLQMYVSACARVFSFSFFSFLFFPFLFFILFLFLVVSLHRAPLTLRALEPRDRS